MKVTRTVLTGGKGSDNFKLLPICIIRIKFRNLKAALMAAFSIEFGSNKCNKILRKGNR
ncbi:hypothetical protein ACDX78_11425 [Virgibacillus oceani]